MTAGNGGTGKKVPSRWPARTGFADASRLFLAGNDRASYFHPEFLIPAWLNLISNRISNLSWKFNLLGSGCLILDGRCHFGAAEYGRNPLRINFDEI